MARRVPRATKAKADPLAPKVYKVHRASPAPPVPKAIGVKKATEEIRAPRETLAPRERPAQQVSEVRRGIAAIRAPRGRKDRKGTWAHQVRKVHEVRKEIAAIRDHKVFWAPVEIQVHRGLEEKKAIGAMWARLGHKGHKGLKA